MTLQSMDQDAVEREGGDDHNPRPHLARAIESLRGAIAELRLARDEQASHARSRLRRADAGSSGQPRAIRLVHGERRRSPLAPCSADRACEDVRDVVLGGAPADVQALPRSRCSPCRAQSVGAHRARVARARRAPGGRVRVLASVGSAESPEDDFGRRGDSHAAPCAAARTAAATPSIGVSFARKPHAPASTAVATALSSATTVSATIARRGSVIEDLSASPPGRRDPAFGDPSARRRAAALRRAAPRPGHRRPALRPRCQAGRRAASSDRFGTDRGRRRPARESVGICPSLHRCCPHHSLSRPRCVLRPWRNAHSPRCDHTPDRA